MTQQLQAVLPHQSSISFWLPRCSGKHLNRQRKAPRYLIPWPFSLEAYRTSPVSIGIAIPAPSLPLFSRLVSCRMMSFVKYVSNFRPWRRGGDRFTDVLAPGFFPSHMWPPCSFPVELELHRSSQTGINAEM